MNKYIRRAIEAIERRYDIPLTQRTVDRLNAALLAQYDGPEFGDGTEFDGWDERHKAAGLTPLNTNNLWSK